MRKQIRIPEGQVHLPFQSKAARGVMSYATSVERKTLLVLATLLVVCALSYVYFIMSSVTYAAKAEELNRESKLVATEVSRLEAEYLALADTLTENHARYLGYVEPKDQVYVERKSFVSVR